MLAAEISTLPAAMRSAVRAFFDANEAWLTGVLEAGRASGELAFAGSARDLSRLLTGTLEGAMLLARSYGEPTRLANAARHMLDGLSAAPPAPAAPRRRSPR
jgi:TetR/AcrR family transcriptional repressor of nem operon